MSESPRRVLAFDVGTRRIGVAAGDLDRGLAFPVTTIPVSSRAAALERILELVREHRPEALLVGHPLNLDGSRGPAALRCEKFARLLGELSGLTIHLEDERLTTAMAERALIEQDLSRRRRRQVIDQAAAVLLLQGWLERQRGTWT